MFRFLEGLVVVFNVSLSLTHPLALFVILSGVSNSISRPKKVQRKGELYKLQHVEVTYELITFTITKRKKLASENIKFNER